MEKHLWDYAVIPPANDIVLAGYTTSETICGVLLGDLVEFIGFSFSMVSVDGQSDVVADAPGDVLTLIAGDNITITTLDDSITISATDGIDGVDGSVWRNGTGDPDNGLGVNGDYYLDDATGDVWEKSAGVYSVVANIVGPQGPAGPDLADGDKGDIVVSASGTTWTIDDGVVSYEKMQNVSATNKILGRSTAGAGVVEEIACTATGRSILDDANVSAVRDTIELGAANSPEFTGIELGHASDTTITRVSAGVVAIEGVTILTTSTGLVIAGKSGGQTAIGGTASGENLTLQSTSHATRGYVNSADKHLFSKSAYFAEVDNGSSGTADTIDWTLSNKQKSTLTGNCIFTFTAPSGPCNLVLKLVQDATGSRTVTWPAAVHWSGGTAPTLTTTANKVDIICFYYDGTTYFGSSVLNFTA